MRKKHAVKKDNLWDGLSLLQKSRMAHYGDAYDPNNPAHHAAARLHDELSEAFFLEKGFSVADWPGVTNEETHKRIAAMRHSRAWNVLKAIFQGSVETGYGAVFRALADIIDRTKNPVDPALAFVSNILQSCYQRHTPPPPIQKMVDALKRHGITSSYNQVKRYYEYFGVKPSPGKRGAPKGTVQKRIVR
jgi:hypothetical protein